MINPILFLSALGPDMIDEGISKLEKCNVSGKIKKIEIKNDNECLNSVKILVSGDNGYYKVNVSKTTGVDCSHDSIYLLYGDKNLPKVGDKLDLLLENNGYSIISDEKVGDGVYKLTSGNNSEGNTEICEPNSSFVEQNENYLYFGIILCIIIIIGIVINMNLKKK